MKAKTQFSFLFIFVLASCLAFSFVNAVSLNQDTNLYSNESNITVTFIGTSITCDEVNIDEASIVFYNLSCDNQAPSISFLNFSIPNSTHDSGDGDFCYLSPQQSTCNASTAGINDLLGWFPAIIALAIGSIFLLFFLGISNDWDLQFLFSLAGGIIIVSIMLGIGSFIVSKIGNC